MLQFFRRIVASRVGVVITFGVLILIAILFGLGDVTGFMNGGGAGGGSVASVGGETVGAADLRRRVGQALQVEQQQQPTITIQQYVAGGGVESVLGQFIGDLALARFAGQNGMAVSRRSVDGQIASAPSLQDATGRFDQKLYEALLGQQHLSDAQVRGDIGRTLLTQQLVLPTVGANTVPAQVALPYADLLLEKRTGTIALIPAAAMPAGAAPTDAEVQGWFDRHRARYVVPERRVIRYALATPDSVKAQAAPSEAEVAAAYRTRAAEFAPGEKRDVTQVTVLDQAAAGALAAKVKAGTPIDAAARAAGLEPRALTGLTKAAYATQSSPALADAVFAAPAGGVVGPVSGGIGYVVAKVGRVEKVPGKTLDQARPELVQALTASKGAALLQRLRDRVSDALDNRQTFAELVAGQHLEAKATPALTASGGDPDNATAAPDPALAPILAAGFQMEGGDNPQLVPVGDPKAGGFAVVALDHAVPAAPPPLARIRTLVAHDVAADRAQRAARAAAGQVLAKANGGQSLAQAIAASGVRAPAPRPITATRGQITGGGRNVPPPLALLFSMQPRTNKLLEAPGGQGWYVIHLDGVQAGDAKTQPGLADATRAQFGRVVGRELAEQFSLAVQAQVGVKRDAAAIAKLKADLAGTGGAAQ